MLIICQYTTCQLHVNTQNINCSDIQHVDCVSTYLSTSCPHINVQLVDSQTYNLSTYNVNLTDYRSAV